MLQLCLLKGPFHIALQFTGGSPLCPRNPKKLKRKNSEYPWIWREQGFHSNCMHHQCWSPAVLNSAWIRKWFPLETLCHRSPYESTHDLLSTLVHIWGFGSKIIAYIAPDEGKDILFITFRCGLAGEWGRADNAYMCLVMDRSSNFPP